MSELDPSEILKRVRELEIRTRRLVTTLFAGQYHSSFKGQGMTFAEFREYVPGDDVRTISWPVTARTGKTFIKKFDEERELTFMLAVDISASSAFGSKHLLKTDVMAHLAALFGFAAIRNNDQVGALLYAENVEHYVRPRKGNAHVSRILRDILAYQAENRPGTGLKTAARHLLQVLKKRATVVIISDFWDGEFAKELSQLSNKHEVICVKVRDPLEQELPTLGVVQFRDLESNDVVTLDTSAKAARVSYAAQVKKFDSELAQVFRQAQVETISVTTQGDFLRPVIDYFRTRG